MSVLSYFKASAQYDKRPDTIIAISTSNDINRIEKINLLFLVLAHYK